MENQPKLYICIRGVKAAKIRTTGYGLSSVVTIFTKIEVGDVLLPEQIEQYALTELLEDFFYAHQILITP